jgi:hypothetical protein
MRIIGDHQQDTQQRKQEQENIIAMSQPPSKARVSQNKTGDDGCNRQLPDCLEPDPEKFAGKVHCRKFQDRPKCPKTTKKAREDKRLGCRYFSPSPTIDAQKDSQRECN